VNPVASVVSFDFAIRYVIIYDTAGGSIPLEAAAKLHRHVGEDATGRRDVPLFDVRHRSLLIATRGKEIMDAPRA
jgi:hypothetical protein